MPVETFHTLISRNKRNSFVLIGVFMLLFIGMGLLMGSTSMTNAPARGVSVKITPQP